MARTRKAKLPSADEVARAVNYWLACGWTQATIAEHWEVTWSAVTKALHRGGYILWSDTFAWYEKNEEKNSYGND